MRVRTYLSQKSPRKISQNSVIYTVVFIGIFSLWLTQGFLTVGIHADLARDLFELSNLWIGRIVWLGPHLSAGFPVSPLYYYLLFPGLILSRGNAYSIIVSHALFALLPLVLLVWFQRPKPLWQNTVTILPLAFAPWWITAATHPWNGHMYIAWALLFCILAWEKKHFFLIAISLGIATAIHPAATLLLPVLIYEWWLRDNKLKNALFSLIGIFAPWTPIFLFEMITKGYLTRQFLLLRTQTIQWNFSPLSLWLVASLLDLSKTLFIILILLTLFFARRRTLIWLTLLSLGTLPLILFSGLHDYYFLGIATALFFIEVKTFSRNFIGQLLLLTVITFYVISLYQTPLTFSERSFAQQQTIVEQSIEKFRLEKEKQYAVVSIIDELNSAPQADDYRFFLRMKGYQVVNADQHAQAEKLLLFIEPQNFDWQHWSHWSLDTFGERKVEQVQKVNGITIIEFQRN